MTTQQPTAGAAPKQLISPKALAARWDISKASIYRWQNTGVLTPIKIAGSVRFDLKQVEELERKG